MRKLATIVLVFVATIAHAQQQEKQKTVNATGSAVIERETTAYRIKVTLNMDQVYYSDPQCKTLEEFKDKYYSALTKEGFDPTKFEEKKMEFLTLGYQKEGTILQFYSTSKQMAEKLMNVKMNGVSLQYSAKATLTSTKKDILRKEALADARAHAMQLCKIAGTTIGDIVYISENAPRTDVWKSYYDSYEELLSITVSFQME
jgi:uncharacterized protein YggE